MKILIRACFEMKRAIPLLIAALALTACGAGKVAMDSGKSFDRYACMSKNLKGQDTCSNPTAPTTQP